METHFIYDDLKFFNEKTFVEKEKHKHNHTTPRYTRPESPMWYLEDKIIKKAAAKLHTEHDFTIYDPPLKQQGCKPKPRH